MQWLQEVSDLIFEFLGLSTSVCPSKTTRCETSANIFGPGNDFVFLLLFVICPNAGTGCPFKVSLSWCQEQEFMPGAHGMN